MSEPTVSILPNKLSHIPCTHYTTTTTTLYNYHHRRRRPVLLLAIQTKYNIVNLLTTIPSLTSKLSLSISISIPIAS